nr:hypothetical protein, conserved in bacteria [uncultured bacterium]
MTGKLGCLLTLWFALCGFASAAATDAPTSMPPATIPLVDDFAYSDAPAAQAAWKPSAEGTAPVSPVMIEGRHALRMPCAFKATRPERACWDRKVKLDLTACRGLQFQLYCPDSSPVSQFSFYLRSGVGWYSASFGQATQRGWTTVKIEKTDTRIEGDPAGWGSIDAIRIGAWRGGEKDTDFYIANLGLLGADAPIAIIRAESSARTNPGEAGSVAEFTQSMARSLDDLGFSHTVIGDLDATIERLKGKKIVILPHNPRLPEALTDTLVQFVQNRGKLVSFYNPLPPRLGQAVGIRAGRHISQARSGQFASIRATSAGLTGEPAQVGQRSWNITHAEPIENQARVAALWFDDQGKSTGEPAIVASDRAVHMTHVLLSDDPAKKPMLVLAMLGHLAPELWEEAAQTRLEAVGRFGAFSGFEDAFKAMESATAGKPAARAALDEAGLLRQEIQRLIGEHKYLDAMAKAGPAREAALRAWSLIQTAQPGERRLWWCHSAFGVEGMNWDEAIKNLADNGFNAILPNMLWGGVAYYESKVLPVAPEIAQRGDQIAQCLAACKKYGVECHVWKVDWNMGGHAPKEFAARMKREGRTQVSYDGKANEQWLCPSHPANQQLEIDAMTEVATKYDVNGIHFDYIRYPGAEGCFCPGCRERFEKVVGSKLKNWPADTRNDNGIKQQWFDFRRENINRVVGGVSERVRKAKPGMKISAAVFPNWSSSRDSIGQDWKMWCERGWLDFVCPMDYTPHEAQFENMVSQQLAWAGKVPVYPGIGLSVWDSRTDAAKLFESIKITRRLKTGGFTVFNYDSGAAREVVPLCGVGITRKE